MADTAIFDVDGTLVDSHHQHALAWFRAFRRVDEQRRQVKRRGFRLVMASSGSAEQDNLFLDLFGARDFADNWTASADVDRSMPAPDILEVALSRVGGGQGVTIGDAILDCAAAAPSAIPTVTVLTGGFSDAEPAHAGAVGVSGSLRQLTDKLECTPLAVAVG